MVGDQLQGMSLNDMQLVNQGAPGPVHNNAGTVQVIYEGAIARVNQAISFLISAYLAILCRGYLSTQMSKPFSKTPDDGRHERFPVAI